MSSGVEVEDSETWERTRKSQGSFWVHLYACFALDVLLKGEVRYIVRAYSAVISCPRDNSRVCRPTMVALAMMATSRYGYGKGEEECR